MHYTNPWLWAAVVAVVLAGFVMFGEWDNAPVDRPDPVEQGAG